MYRLGIIKSVEYNSRLTWEYPTAIIVDCFEIIYYLHNSKGCEIFGEKHRYFPESFVVVTPIHFSYNVVREDNIRKFSNIEELFVDFNLNLHFYNCNYILLSTNNKELSDKALDFKLILLKKIRDNFEDFFFGFKVDHLLNKLNYKRYWEHYPKFGGDHRFYSGINFNKDDITKHLFFSKYLSSVLPDSKSIELYYDYGGYVPSEESDFKKREKHELSAAINLNIEIKREFICNFNINKFKEDIMDSVDFELKK